MGEHAEIMLDGILDWNGEYTGNENNNTTYFKSNGENKKVHRLIRTYGKWKWPYCYSIIMQYGAHIEMEGKSCTQICKHICAGPERTNWNKFKRWLKTDFIPNRIIKKPASK